MTTFTTRSTSVFFFLYFAFHYIKIIYFLPTLTIVKPKKPPLHSKISHHHCYQKSKIQNLKTKPTPNLATTHVDANGHQQPWQTIRRQERVQERREKHFF